MSVYRVGKLEMDQTACAIDRHQHAVGDPLCGNASTDDAGNGILAGDDRAVGQDPARIRDHRRRPSDQRRPGWRRGPAHQNLAGGERIRLRHAVHQPRAALRDAAARAQASHDARRTGVQPEAGKPPLFGGEID